MHPGSNLCFLSSRDLPLLRDAAAVNASFNTLPKEANGFPANKTLQDFLAANFGAAGSDFESAVPEDFYAEPDNFLPNVTDPAIRKWALQVNGLWQDLCREVLPASMPLGFTRVHLAFQIHMSSNSIPYMSLFQPLCAKWCQIGSRVSASMGGLGQ